MSRIKLKCGGKPKRKKALFGVDGAVMAAATLGAAAMNVAATAKASKEQSQAIINNANTQAEVLKQTNENNTNLQKESIEFTRQQNQEIRQQQQDIQASLQMLAGQQNMNDFQERNKMRVKYGGRRKLKKSGISSSPSYGGVRVTDGGDLIALNTDNNGYGLYMAYGDNHEQYHKTPSGKYKTGVGLKLPNGEDLELEGSKKGKGELITIYPDEVTAYSKHKVGDFVPADAILAGVPEDLVAAKQEFNKAVLGYNDDGTKAKCGKRRKLKAMAGINIPVNSTTTNLINTNNINDSVAGAAYIVKQDNISSPVARCGKRVSLRHKAALGSIFNSPYWKNYGGATINTVGNIGAGIIGLIGNSIANKYITKANNYAAKTLADAYNSRTGIDPSLVSRDNYASAHSIATVVDANNINNNAEINKINRYKAAFNRNVDRNTISSAARLNRYAENEDRAIQDIAESNERLANKQMQYREGNANRIQQSAEGNANRDAQAIQNYTRDRLSVAMYNNQLRNDNIMGAAQAYADASMQNANVVGTNTINSANMFGSALAASGNAFAGAYDTYKTNQYDAATAMASLPSKNKLEYAVSYYQQTGDSSLLEALLTKTKNAEQGLDNSVYKSIVNDYGNSRWYKRYSLRNS